MVFLALATIATNRFGKEWEYLSKYRLLALDLDGTTLLNNHEISRNTSLAIQNVVKAGIIVVFSTGRGVPNTKIYWEKLGISISTSIAKWGRDMDGAWKTIEKTFY